MKKLKESDIAVIGVIVTVILYVMNVLGTGVIVGGDVGRIGRGLPFYGFVAPFLFIALAAFVGYYTKKYSMKKAFTAVYVTLVLPFAAEAVLIPIASESIRTPWIIAPMYLAMPINSLSTYLFDAIYDFGRAINISGENLAWAIVPHLLLLPLVTAPFVYRFTKARGDE